MTFLSKPDKCAACGRPTRKGSTCRFCTPHQLCDDATLGAVGPQIVPMPAASGLTVATEAAQLDGARGFLYVYQGKGRGLSLLLGDRPVTIGRDAANVLSLDDPGVSSRHCEVRPGPGGILVRDAGSKNGTFVGTERVTERALANGEVIAFGGGTRIYVGIL